MKTNSEITLNNIFLKHSNIDFNKNECLKNENVFGNKIGLNPRELVLILFEIENEFEISITKNIIANGNFNSYINILNLVNNELDQKRMI